MLMPTKLPADALWVGATVAATIMMLSQLLMFSSIEMGDAVETARYKSVCLKTQRCSLYTGLYCLSSNFPCNTLP